MPKRRPFELPETLSLFPLPGAIILPRTRLPLHIFEPRYISMFDDALKTSERLIGLIQPLTGESEALQNIGCAGRIIAFEESEDGRYMVTLGGINRFSLINEVEGFTPYRRAEIEWSIYPADDLDREADLGFDRPSFLKRLGNYMRHSELETDWESLEQADPELLINSLSMLLPFAPEEKQALLEAPLLSDRRQVIETLLEFGVRDGFPGKGALQ